MGTPTYIPQNDPHDALIIWIIHKWGKRIFLKKTSPISSGSHQPRYDPVVALPPRPPKVFEPVLLQIEGKCWRQRRQNFLGGYFFSSHRVYTQNTQTLENSKMGEKHTKKFDLRPGGGGGGLGVWNSNRPPPSDEIQSVCFRCLCFWAAITPPQLLRWTPRMGSPCSAWQQICGSSACSWQQPKMRAG